MDSSTMDPVFDDYGESSDNFFPAAASVSSFNNPVLHISARKCDFTVTRADRTKEVQSKGHHESTQEGVYNNQSSPEEDQSNGVEG